ncbi:NUMOD3 domain-containing DNA-binding protein [Paraclostridium dentum]|uniref:NUMOD3 domain-containing DNA-binding protein n=1 Tax=Paraclostridium dentum TaxID=2662455 RepID=UPI003B00199C
MVIIKALDMTEAHQYNLHLKGNQYSKGCKKNEKHKQLISKVHKNKKLSDETKIKIFKARKGKYKGEENPFYNKHHTQDTINKIKENVNKSKILCIETKKVYESISECSRDINIDRSNISKVCRSV